MSRWPLAANIILVAGALAAAVLDDPVLVLAALTTALGRWIIA